MNKLRAAVYGLVVGDALGVPVEFKKRGSFYVEEMTGFGTYNQPPGTWSDDSSMTLATCDSIREMGRIDLDDLRRRFENWLFHGAYRAGESLFDYGRTTYEALKGGCGINDYQANGNGSLMRIIPLAFLDVSDSEIEAVSALTHAHPISKEACCIYINIARHLLAGQALSAILKGLKVSAPFADLKNLEALPESQVSSSGFVIHTLQASLWCLLQTNSFSEAVLKAVNLGDDSDTTGAVTGALAGIVYGYEAIPRNWIAELRNKELIEHCLFDTN
ncbi:ADP-ribosylglycohydrolase family protein [Streptococcus sp. H49]|uniref:ADP-ribosylglycohydrolase family protein n=1 Tax=Streptococcus huangxiaojuni TaxID=3237239 RepID=UPI0034A42406